MADTLTTTTENDYVCSRTTMRGTHKGKLSGISATGNSVVVSGLTMVPCCRWPPG
jgi:hypothetical protein